MSNAKIFTSLFLAVFATQLGVGIIVPFLPLYAESMTASGTWIGIMYAAYFISRTVSTPVMGIISDRKGRRIFIAAGLFVYVLISLGYVWASNIQELTTVRFIHGCASAVILPIAMAYIGEMSTPDRLATNMGIFSMALFAGLGFGPLIGGVIADYFTMDASFYTLGGLSLIALVLVLFFIPELEIYKKEKLRVPILKAIQSDSVKGLISFRLSNSFSRGVFLCFLPILAGFHFDFTLTQIGILAAAQPISASILQPFFGRLADRYSRRYLVVIGSLLDPICLALLPFAQSFSQLLILCIISGVGRAICFPAASAMVINEGKRFGIGASSGIFNMTASLGMAAGPLVGGFFLDAIGLNIVFYTTGIIAVISTALFIWFTRYSE